MLRIPSFPINISPERITPASQPDKDEGKAEKPTDLTFNTHMFHRLSVDTLAGGVNHEWLLGSLLPEALRSPTSLPRF